jgi:integrase
MTDEQPIEQKPKKKQKGHRRGQGSGSVYQRDSDDRWISYIDLGWVDGKRKRKYFSGHTEKEVTEKLNRALGDQARGKVIPTDSQTVGQFLGYWLEHVAAPSVRPKTLDGYRDVVRIHLIPAIGKVKLEKLSPQHVNKLINDKMKTDLSPTMVAYIRSVLRNALNQALQWELVTRNAAAMVKMPRTVKTFAANPLSEKDAQAFLKQTIGNRDEALYAVALALGLRQGEVLGLKWTDVDLDAGQLHIRRQLQWTTDKPMKPVLVEPKTARSTRTLAMPPAIIADLKAHRRRQLEEQLLAGDRWEGKAWCLVFPTSIGTPYHNSNLRNRFKAILKKAGLEERRYHDLRHSCASFLVAKGVHPRVVMEYMGHAGIEPAMQIYSHVHKDSLQDAANTMNDLLGSKTELSDALG